MMTESMIIQPDKPDPVRVLLITEGTYPYYFGGVSTWAHLLLRGLPQVDFTLMSIAADPAAKLQFELPSSVRQFMPVALWGTYEALETRHDLSLASIFRQRRTTTDSLVAAQFIPLFRPFLEAILTEQSDPEHLGRLIHQMYRFFLAFDFDSTLRSRTVWACFVQAVQESFARTAAAHGYPEARFDLSDLTHGMQWLYRWLTPLAKPLPQVDVVHTAMVGVSTLVAAAVKLEYDAAYLLTEHGVYLRESYLAEAPSSGSLFLKLFKLSFSRRMTEISYALADQIAPCCDYNQRWELRNGAPRSRVKTIYYGVDGKVFAPAGKPVGDPPVVVWVGRINPLKDLDTLLRAAALVHQARPDIQFRLFGSAAAEDQAYHQEMLALHSQLGLGDAVTFCGYISKPETAYNQADVVVLSSISEAFPFSILEAMLCAKPVVATSVGGIPEEIAGGGITVEPRNPQQMAEGILSLMNDPEYCAALGRAAREKAEREFGIEQCSRVHYETYVRLSRRHGMLLSLPIFSNDEPAGESLPVSSVLSSGSEADLSRHDSQAAGHGHRLALALRKSPATSVHRPTEFKTLDASGVAELAVQVARRVPLPVDSLEITAILESLGVTDGVAARRYGAPDVFSLADAVLAQMRLEC